MGLAETEAVGALIRCLSSGFRYSSVTRNISEAGALARRSSGRDPLPYR